VNEDDRDDEEDTGPIRLWPALVALGVAAVLAVSAIVVVVSDGDLGAEDSARAGEMPMRTLLVAPARQGLVRLIVDGACRKPVRATADLGADTVALAVLGLEPEGGCEAAPVRPACVAVVLSQSVGPRSVLPRPDPSARAVAERAATSAACRQIPVEEG
jgi:hypothetical protein